MEQINQSTVQRDIDAYLTQVLPKVDLVIGVLRYGAHLPHLWRDSSALKEPIPMVLSHMVDFLPRQSFLGKRLLVLDDTIYRGRQMQDNVDRLLSLGVPRDCIHSGAVIVHEESQFHPTFPPLRSYGEEDYIRWKIAFSGLVRSQRRSIDRDHPLYFFQIKNATSGELLTILERFGYLSARGDCSYGNTYSFVTTIKSALLNRGVQGSFVPEACAGLNLADICKVRLYWEVDATGGIALTLVPMVFAALNFQQFFSSNDNSLFTRLTGVPFHAINYLKEELPVWQRFVFFLITRSVAAGLLLQFLEDFAAQLRVIGADIKSVNPNEEDYPVRNILPQAYDEFHALVRSKIQETLDRPLSSTALIPFPWPKPQAAESTSFAQHGMPEKYSILDALTRDQDAATFDGRKWVPFEESRIPATFNTLRQHMSSSVALSVALDELLDVGLLRAKDALISPDGPCYARAYLPGGEYNALQVSRIARNWRTKPMEFHLPDGTTLEDWY